MNDTQATLLLTRPAPQSRAFLAECEKLLGRRIPVVISPLLRIVPMMPIPEFEKYATLIFTSANGVAVLSENLAGRIVVTVGDRTCAIAQQSGANAISLGNDAEALIARAGDIIGPALHCRGVYALGDLAARLTALGVETDEMVVYDQVSQPLNQAAEVLLQSPAKVIAPVFSPRSAKLLSENQISSDLHVVAMSAAVAEAWGGPGVVEVTDAPTSVAVAECAVRQF